MLNRYQVNYMVTYIRQREVLATTTQEAVNKVSEEVLWERPYAVEILSSAFIGKQEPEDLTDLHAIMDKMHKCARDEIISDIVAMNNCACRKAAKRHERIYVKRSI